MEELGLLYLTETPLALADWKTIKEKEEPAATFSQPSRPPPGGLQGWEHPRNLHLYLPHVPHLWGTQPTQRAKAWLSAPLQAVTDGDPIVLCSYLNQDQDLLFSRFWRLPQNIF